MDTNIYIPVFVNQIDIKMIYLIYLYEMIFLWMDTDHNLIYH